VRGGAIPLLAWGMVLLILGAINWIWTGDAIQVGTFGFAVLAVWAGAGLLIVLAGRRALRRGPPEPDPRPQSVPQGSLGAVLAALSVSSIVFGFVFGTFLIYFGAGLLLISIGRLTIERRSELETRRRAAQERLG
jgi:multisubunit Na+/H+ antiporter MnhC subunit